MRNLFIALSIVTAVVCGVVFKAYAAGDVSISLGDEVLKWKDVWLSTSEVDALNGTAVELIPAPGSGKYLDLVKMTCTNDFTGSHFEAGSGTLDIRYTNSSGSLAAQFPNVFVEATSDNNFTAYGRDVMAADNAALVAHLSSDATATSGCTGIIKCRVYYRILQVSDI